MRRVCRAASCSPPASGHARRVVMTTSRCTTRSSSASPTTPRILGRSKLLRGTLKTSLMRIALAPRVRVLTTTWTTRTMKRSTPSAPLASLLLPNSPHAHYLLTTGEAAVFILAHEAYSLHGIIGLLSLFTKHYIFANNSVVFISALTYLSFFGY
ncbi:hypothetical protein C8J57DRAFT_1397407 [Mycena rebaudengoi]|nr:hypothetical protein C8J57DRAFT_1397407 [Mycena rebaudengoi]